MSRWRPGPNSPTEEDSVELSGSRFLDEVIGVTQPTAPEPAPPVQPSGSGWWQRPQAATDDDDDGPPTLAPGFGTAAPAYGRPAPAGSGGSGESAGSAGPAAGAPTAHSAGSRPRSPASSAPGPSASSTPGPPATSTPGPSASSTPGPSASSALGSPSVSSGSVGSSGTSAGGRLADSSVAPRHAPPDSFDTDATAIRPAVDAFPDAPTTPVPEAPVAPRSRREDNTSIRPATDWGYGSRRVGSSQQAPATPLYGTSSPNDSYGTADSAESADSGPVQSVRYGAPAAGAAYDPGSESPRSGFADPDSPAVGSAYGTPDASRPGPTAGSSSAAGAYGSSAGSSAGSPPLSATSPGSAYDPTIAVPAGEPTEAIPSSPMAAMPGPWHPSGDETAPVATSPHAESPTTPSRDEPDVPDKPRQGARRLLGATVIMAAGTIASRLLGLVRVILAAALLGTNSRQADIFSVATTVPNSLYILFAGGALNTVLVPQLVRAVKNDKDGGEAYTNRIMTAFLLLVGVVSAILVIAAPVVAWIYTDGGWHTAEMQPQFESLVLLTALCLPQVFFYGAFFLFGQVLNARDAFGPMMWAPIANNVVQVIVLAIYGIVWQTRDSSQPFTTQQALLLGLGSVLGIVAQVAMLVPFMRKVGFTYRPRFDLKGTGLGHTFSLAKWTLGFVAVNQVALLVVTKLATSATAEATGAGLTTYNNANLLWVLPHSLITVGLATAMLPSLSRMAADNDVEAVRFELTTAIRMATAALVPIALLYLAIGIPIAELAFRAPGKGGDLVGWTLMAFAIGLIPFSVQYLVLRGYYAFEDTRSTFLLQMLIAGVNAVGALLLVKFVSPGPDWVAPMLALSYTIAYVAGLAVSLHQFQKLVPDLDLPGIGKHIAKVAVAAVPGTVVAAAVVWFQARRWDGLIIDFVGLAVGAGIAVVGYILIARTLKIAEVQEVVDLVMRRLGRRRKPVAHAKENEAVAPAKSDEAWREPGADPSQETREVEAIDESHTAALDEPQAQADDLEETSAWATPFADIPSQPTDPEIPPVDTTPGDLLGHRYRLDQLIVTRGSTQTWQAYDQVLSRYTLVHLLSLQDPRAPQVLEAARQAARATDSRFLRVLDAVDDDGYIVCEWSDGMLLQNLLDTGPLTALESAWVVRELADALSAMHAAGLYHQQLTPNSVVISTTGNVKIVGLLIDEALQPTGAMTPKAQEGADVEGLGKLLYACLCARWPGEAAYGLAEAPTDSRGGLLAPAKVRTGVSPTLDRITADILSPGSTHALTSAVVIARELSAVLGSADASGDLANRVRFPHRTPAPFDETSVIGPHHEDTTALPVEPAFTPPAQTTQIRHGAVEPSGRGVAPAQKKNRTALWLVPLIALIAISVVVGLILGLRGRDSTANPSPGAATSAAPTGPYPIATVKDFDPESDGGNGDENPNQVTLAYDGKTDTAWTTLSYRGNAKLGGLKPGVGLVVDLGSAQKIGHVIVTLQGQPTDIEIRVPSQNPETVDQAPMNSQSQWTVVAKQTATGTNVDLAPDKEVKSRYVLIYLTSLPPVSGNYKGAIAEIEVRA